MDSDEREPRKRRRGSTVESQESHQNPNTSTMNNPTTSVSTVNSSTTMAYSAALTQHTYKYPNKEQAIVFPSVDGLKKQDYLLNLGPIVNPKNILFCSRVYNNRVCVYLSSKQIIDQFLETTGEIIINGESLRALITPSDRLVMSNVSPTIPHRLLKDKLEQIGLHLVSPISFLRIGATVPEYSHILSFRRQAYITPISQDIFPESMEITYEDLTYRIFLSVDSHRCFKCQLPGHNASQCPSTQLKPTSPAIDTETLRNPANIETTPALIQQKPNTLNYYLEQDTTSTITINANLIQHTPAQISQQEPSENDSANNSHTTNKRRLSAVITPTSDKEPILEISDNCSFAAPKQRTTKKYKAYVLSNSHIPDEAFLPIKTFIESHTPPLVLNSDQIKNLLENTHGIGDIINIINDHTSDTKGLIEMLLLIYPHITDTTLKNRCTRLLKKIEKHLDNNPSDTVSDTSSIDSIV
nr:unnamed protein product [Callosobruchus chinensis]